MPFSTEVNLSFKRCSLLSTADLGGSESRTMLASTKGQSVRGAALGGGSVRRIDRKPRAYPVLRRSVESRTVSGDDISRRSCRAHFHGRDRRLSRD